MGEDLFSGLWKPHISGHLHSLVDDVGLACNQVRRGENAFGSSIAYLDRGHDIVRLGAEIQVVDRRAFCNAGCGFGLEEATEVHIHGMRSGRH